MVRRAQRTPLTRDADKPRLPALYNKSCCICKYGAEELSARCLKCIEGKDNFEASKRLVNHIKASGRKLASLKGD